MVPLLLSLLAASQPADAATAQALVELRGEEVRLIDVLLVPTDARRAPRGPSLTGPLLEVRGPSGSVLGTAPVPDARQRSVVAPHGEHGAAVVLDRAIARVDLDWPAGATTVALGAQQQAPRVAPPGTATAVLESGDSEARLDMVFLGDGYTDAELATFAADVDRMAAYMLSIEPYGAYSDLFNVWRIDQASAESGVSHFEGDLEDERDTAYGCYYGCAGIDRLICCDDAAVMEEVRANVPGADGVMVLINDPTYGGSGGFNYATSYTAGASGEKVAVHELGHSLVGLGDEYSYGTSTGRAPMPNCSESADEAPWSAWLDDPDVGLFAVCGYTNHYRPTRDTCMMRSLRDDYCVVCREQAVLAVYDAIPRLLTAVSPAEGAIGLEAGPVPFSAEAIGADAGRFEVVWQLDGATVGTGWSWTASGCADAGALTLSVQDPTPWVRSDPRGLLVDGAAWTLEPCAGTDGTDGTDGGDASDGTDGAETGTPDPDSGGGDGVDAVDPAPAPPATGCGCSTGNTPAAGLSLLLLALVGRRRGATPLREDPAPAAGAPGAQALR